MSFGDLTAAAVAEGVATLLPGQGSGAYFDNPGQPRCPGYEAATNRTARFTASLSLYRRDRKVACDRERFVWWLERNVGSRPTGQRGDCHRGGRHRFDGPTARRMQKVRIDASAGAHDGVFPGWSKIGAHRRLLVVLRSQA